MMAEAIGISLKTLLQDTYQLLQVRYEERNPNQERVVSERLYLNMNNLSDFLEKGSIYVLSGCTPVQNREAMIGVTYGIMKDNESDSSALVFLIKTKIQDWMLQMFSKYSAIPISRLQSGSLNTDDWRNLAAATGQMAEADIRVFAVEDESELFRDVDALLREGDTYNHIFIDSLEVNGGNLVQLKQLALDFNSTVVISSRAFKGLELPEISKVV